MSQESSEHLEALREVARAIFSDHATAEAVDAAAAGPGWSPELWARLDEAGLTRLSLPESRGGGGGELADAAEVLRIAGEFAAPVPLAETALVGGWLFAAAGWPLPDGPITAASGALDLEPDGEAWRVAGRLARVPWAGVAEQVAVLVPGADGDRVVCLGADAVKVTAGRNLAGEPRDDLTVEATVPADRVAAAEGSWAAELALRAALGRTLLIAGAAERALAATTRFVGEREQFGRAIARFQAVQQQLAELAGEVAAITGAAEAATQVVAEDGVTSSAGRFAVAAAKTQASAAAAALARIAHQLHGAIGFTWEHTLRHTTTRLWAWRDEDGNEHAWGRELAARALEQDADSLWALLTATS